MSEVEREFAVHQAICDQRYKAIEEKLESGKARMQKIESSLDLESQLFVSSRLVLLEFG